MAKTKPKIELDGKILISPRITEKAVISSDKSGVYVFNVTSIANKPLIAKAIKEAYKVTPVKVRIATLPKERTFRRGKKGTTGGGKKAYVYLKKGDKIEVI